MLWTLWKSGFNVLSVDASNNVELSLNRWIIENSTGDFYESDGHFRVKGGNVADSGNLYVTGGTEDNPTSGTLYTRYGDAGTWEPTPWTNTTFIIKRTQDYYSGNKQILSTPFQFYFGLNAGKTGMDKFIDLFGPKGAFPPAE